MVKNRYLLGLIGERAAFIKNVIVLSNHAKSPYKTA